MDAGAIVDAGTADSGSLVDAGMAGDGGGATDGGSPVDLTALPIGDGKYASAPAVGVIFSCQTSFTGGVGGASKDGPWINLDAGTFDYTAKVVVEGSVSWPNHSFSTVVSGSTRDINSNGLPDHDTGTFPIAMTDPAYAYDQNPNSIQVQSILWSLPQLPTVAASPTCLGGGAIGIMLSGSELYDALDGEGRDALAHETQDACQAHPDPSGTYHYHWVSTCLPDRARDTRRSWATRATASASTVHGARTGKSSPTPISTSATGTPTPSPGTARP